MASNTLREDALKCIDILNERGWCQGMSRDENGRFCALGAIAHASGYNDLTYAELRRAFSRLGQCPSVVDFNDAPDQTKEEVIAVFQRIADEATEQPQPD
jgi:hypothetical protein